MARDRARRERGQATIEHVALVLLVAAVLAAVAAATGLRPPGPALAEAVAVRLVCAAGLSASCEVADELALAYGADVADLVRDHAPTIFYEGGMRELPVDPRACRRDRCSYASGSRAVWRTDAGHPASAFTHVVDCRPADDPVAARSGFDCSGERAGNLYLQYWLYYPDSETEPWGKAGHHRDDWESFQVRLGAGAAARASSHRSYAYAGGPGNWPTDAGLWEKSAWGPYTGLLFVSAGSHAGRLRELDPGERFTPATRLRLVPIEPIAGAWLGPGFAVAPPWRKPVYRDPEEEGT